MRTEDIHAEHVADYLSKNPQFFHVFPNLLDKLSIPHPSNGKAVSLLERQVWQLREQRDKLQDEVDSLVSIAGDNGLLLQKIQQLSRLLMAAETEQDAVEVLYSQMDEVFKVEYMTLVSWEVPNQSLRGLSQLGVRQDWVKTLRETLQAGKPVCGLIEQKWKSGLFKGADDLHSVCCLPLGMDRAWGVLALGSTTERFHPELGTYFLKVMAELITARLSRLFG
ncbi:DUF484 family protein [Thiomicrospira sp. R3]|uniref:DUF484 family protein n=1 Tax=Thiomicrospira sp. R3 TaxID=3035472 RepID=UPI00259B9DCB|nr:DUF484 family protein [Thiomicrospira sp. R3]WFE68009.1 DUF484 family protein [Thiomicrospira sp. R3]